MMEPGTAADWAKIAGGVVAAGFALWKYTAAQSRKRVEFVAAEMKEFFADPKIRLALTLVDYDEVRLHRDGTEAAATDGDGIDFDGAIVARALRSHLHYGATFSNEEMVARTAFDALLSRLDQCGSWVETGLVRSADLRPYLGYWLRRMADPTAGRPDLSSGLWEFIDAYGYIGVRALLESFGIAHPPVPPTSAMALEAGVPR